MEPQGQEVMDNWIIIEDHPDYPGHTAPELIGECFNLPYPIKQSTGGSVLEPTGRLTYVNGRVCQAYGYRPRRAGE